MPIPPGALRDAESKLTVFCHRHSPARVADRLRYEFSQGRNDMFIHERRPSFTGEASWSTLSVARFRYNHTRGEWFLYWCDRNERWHQFVGVAGSADINDLLAVVEADPTGIFWG